MPVSPGISLGMTQGRTIFVLSGGGSRGAGQVGMLRALFRAGITPDLLVGGSVGAINACFVASRPTAEGVEELAAYWRGVSEEALCGSRRAAVLNLARRRPYLFSGDRLRSLVRTWIPTWHLEDLAVPVRIATTDISTGLAVHHSHGYLPDLVAASAALPGLFPPVTLPGREGPVTHVDAGISENVPLSAALADAGPGDRVFVLDVTRIPATSLVLRNPLDVLVASLMASVRNRPEPVLPDGVEVVRCKLEESFDCGPILDFSHTEELIRLGERAVTEVLAALPDDDDEAAPAAA